MRRRRAAPQMHVRPASSPPQPKGPSRTTTSLRGLGWLQKTGPISGIVAAYMKDWSLFPVITPNVVYSVGLEIARAGQSLADKLEARDSSNIDDLPGWEAYLAVGPDTVPLGATHQPLTKVVVTEPPLVTEQPRRQDVQGHAERERKKDK